MHQDNDSQEQGKCKIISINSTWVNVSLTEGSAFQIYLHLNSCNLGVGPVITMCAIIVIWLFISFLFIIIDLNIKVSPQTPYEFILYYPLSAIFIKQPLLRRFIIISQLFASELFLLATIGAFINYFNDPKQQNNAEFIDYDPKQIIIGAVAWSITQLFSIPIFILNAVELKRKIKTSYITIPVCIIANLLSVFAIAFMTSVYCYGFTQYWITSFLIFSIIDIFIFQVIYSFLGARFILSDMTENKDSEIKDSKDDSKHNTTYVEESVEKVDYEINEDESHYEIIVEE